MAIGNKVTSDTLVDKSEYDRLKELYEMGRRDERTLNCVVHGHMSDVSYFGGQCPVCERDGLRAALIGIRDTRVLTDCGIDPLRAAGMRQALEITREIAVKALEGNPDEKSQLSEAASPQKLPHDNRDDVIKGMSAEIQLLTAKLNIADWGCEERQKHIEEAVRILSAIEFDGQAYEAIQKACKLLGAT